jgi:hypothetical protein
MHKVMKSCRKLAQKLSCMDTLWVEPNYLAGSAGTGSGSLRTPAGSFEPMIGATSAVRTPPHYSAGKGPADDNEAPGFHIHHHQWDP